jgi:hypothetical protein
MARQHFLIPLVVYTSFMFLHLYTSPYTKVEESFNIQATHDILKHGAPLFHKNAHAHFKTHYDHMTFPGAVPRTFLGSLVLASVAKPCIWVGHLQGEGQQFLGEWRWVSDATGVEADSLGSQRNPWNVQCRGLDFLQCQCVSSLWGLGRELVYHPHGESVSCLVLCFKDVAEYVRLLHQ